MGKRFFFIRESFYESLDTKFFSRLFQSEWSTIYNDTAAFSKIWFVFIKNSPNYSSIITYVQSKNLFNLFNITNNTTNKTNTGLYSYFNIYWGFVSFWKALKYWVFSLTFFLTSFYVLLVKRTGVLPQTLFFWVGVSMLLYWLLSGFVFFVKKYQFSRYTSVIQRFWRRTYILFWLIESCLLLVFFYLMVNSSQESFYMFDQGYFLKTHLFSWKIFIFKCTLVVALITYAYLFLLNLKWSTFNKNLLNLVVLTGLLIYLVWTEFYQIYWVSNFYANFSWLYDFEDSIWSLEWDARRTRIVNHYIMILFLLKFWHIVFIFACWVFFLLRANELETITYPLYSFNFQNFIILFLMMWLFMYPWFRLSFHWFSEIPYYWFYVDTHATFFKVLVNDLLVFFTSVYENLLYRFNYSFVISDFINWNVFDMQLDKGVFIKSTIKELVLKSLL